MVESRLKFQDKHGGKRQATSVKVDGQRLDTVMELVGELVVIKSQLLEEQEAQTTQSTRIQALLALLDKNIRDLYDKTLSLRMTTVKNLLERLERAARDAALKVNKEIDFKVEGEDCEMDRALIEKVADPMMHMIRNAIDHGLESPQGRLEAKKSTFGKVLIRVSQSGGSIIFEISDDGRGIDPERVLEKAKAQGLLTDASKSLSTAEVHQLIFRSGFSTASAVSELSGRGVGLDIVKTAIQSMNGSIDVKSEVGKGTTFILRLPLTTAIADGLIVRLGQERYVLQLDAVEEVLSRNDVSIVKVDGRSECLQHQGEFIPLINLEERFSIASPSNNLVIVVRSRAHRCGIFVDEIIGQSQVVLKKLHELLSTSQGVAGTAILGDGRVSLVLDIASL